MSSDIHIATKYKKTAADRNSISDVESLQSAYDGLQGVDPGIKVPPSKVTEADIRTLPVILNLSDLRWRTGNVAVVKRK